MNSQQKEVKTPRKTGDGVQKKAKDGAEIKENHTLFATKDFQLVGQ